MSAIEDHKIITYGKWGLKKVKGTVYLDFPFKYSLERFKGIEPDGLRFNLSTRRPSYPLKLFVENDPDTHQKKCPKVANNKLFYYWSQSFD